MDKKRDDLSVIKAVLDGIDDVIYVADPDTFELLHVNEAFQRFWGKDVLGKKCHRVLQNRETPCPFCTNDKIFGEYAGRSYVWEFQNEVTGDWYRCVDRTIDWVDGRKVRFELASDISSLKQTEKQLREHQNVLEQKVRERTEKLDEELRQREITEQKLRESEAAIRKKLKAISEPDADLEGLTLSDIIDIDQLQPVMEDFHRITGIANAVIDIDGNVLAGVGWQDICTKFHRCHPESQKNCIESDIELSKDIPKGTFKAYRCKNNLWDMATPIMIGDRRLGNLFIGQYLQNDDEFDKALFLDQARRYGFDEEKYMAALARVPRMDKARVKEIMGFFSRFSQMISAMSLNTIQLSRTLTERKQVEQALKHKSSINEAINRVFREVLQYETEAAVAQFALNVAEELTGSRFGFIGEINDQGRLDTIGISNPGWENCNMEGSSATMLITDMAVRGIWSTVVKTGATQIINQPSSHPERVGIPEGHPPLTSFMGVPFIRDNHAVGLIALANKEAGYTERDKETIESLAAPFYEVLLRKRMEIKIREEALKKEVLAELTGQMGGNPSVKQLCTDVITYLCQQLRAPTGLMYVFDETGRLTLGGGYAHRPRKDRSYTYRLGEGLVGQAAEDKKTLWVEKVPDKYLAIESGMIDMPPQVVMLKPIVQNDRVAALLEMGFQQYPDGHQTALLESVDERIASAVAGARAREIQDRMLKESREMTEKLQVQQEELQSANEELEEQTQLLTASEAKLKEQQEELQAANEELEEKSQYLERNKQEVEQKNRGLEDLKKALTRKADDLSIASKYKSEFLANMSHELRTPLNSLLLLSKLLTKNKEQNLTEDQLESIQVIYNSGSQLLSLINEILDLSKIEAGKMQLHFDAIPTAGLVDGLKRDFRHMSENKDLEFVVNIGENCPETIVSDRQRVDQVLKNLVSNAIKFTDQGGVTIDFSFEASGKVATNPDLNGRALMAISIRDTGIGVPEDKQKIIFEAFQQAETGSSRKFGGTGLGLSISRELAHLLGGAIVLESQTGQGATFTLYLPLDHPSEKTDSKRNSRSRPDLFAPTARPSEKKNDPPPPEVMEIPDDREAIDESDKTLLIVEDDVAFGTVLMKLCKERGFKCIYTTMGERALSLAEKYSPRAVILDIKLPDIDGWHVLDGLKSNPATRHIPVHFMSVDDPLFDAFNRGAIGYIKKPVSSEQLTGALEKIESMINKKMKDLLIIEDDANQRKAVIKLLAGEDIHFHEAATGTEALSLMSGQPFDCIVLDLGLPDMTGFDLLEKVKHQSLPPIIVYTGKELSSDQENRLRSYSDSIIVKGVRSEERLLDEASLFLHRVVKNMPEHKKQMITGIHTDGKLLQGKTVMIVDDDMRNVFALSKVLRSLDVNTIKAENGEKALSLLDSKVDLVLMDMMMPVMDGYETMGRIRADNRFSDLPIIALTAKAMKQDKEKCIQAGASDYLSKPVEIDRLLSMMRIWLYR